MEFCLLAEIQGSRLSFFQAEEAHPTLHLILNGSSSASETFFGSNMLTKLVNKQKFAVARLLTASERSPIICSEDDLWSTWLLCVDDHWKFLLGVRAHWCFDQMVVDLVWKYQEYFLELGLE